MPRDSSGTYILPESAPIPGTAIASGSVNASFADLANALTQSLALNGSNKMLGAIKSINGTEANPGFSFVNETSTGIYFTENSGVNYIVWTVNGASAISISDSPSVDFLGSMSVTGSLTSASTVVSDTMIVPSGDLTLQGRPVTSINSGTTCIFYNAAAPATWTKLAINDFAIRSAAAGGGAGGAFPFSTIFSQTATGGATPDVNLHSHVYNSNMGGGPGAITGGARSSALGDTFPSRNWVTNIEGGNSFHIHGYDIRIVYIDVIACAKL